MPSPLAWGHDMCWLTTPYHMLLHVHLRSFVPVVCRLYMHESGRKSHDKCLQCASSTASRLYKHILLQTAADPSSPWQTAAAAAGSQPGPPRSSACSCSQPGPGSSKGNSKQEHRTLCRTRVLPLEADLYLPGMKVCLPQYTSQQTNDLNILEQCMHIGELLHQQRLLNHPVYCWHSAAWPCLLYVASLLAAASGSPSAAGTAGPGPAGPAAAPVTDPAGAELPALQQAQQHWLQAAGAGAAGLAAAAAAETGGLLSPATYCCFRSCCYWHSWVQHLCHSCYQVCCSCSNCCLLGSVPSCCR